MPVQFMHIVVFSVFFFLSLLDFLFAFGLFICYALLIQFKHVSDDPGMPTNMVDMARIEYKGKMLVLSRSIVFRIAVNRQNLKSQKWYECWDPPSVFLHQNCQTIFYSSYCPLMTNFTLFCGLLIILNTIKDRQQE